MKDQINRSGRAEGLATGLGWFSVGLGLAELAAPRAVARFIGVRADDDTVALLQAFGTRELANGVAILAQPDRAAWMWSRVGGDAVDLMSLMQARRTDPDRTIAATAAVLGVTALDIYCAQQLGSGRPRTTRGTQHGVEVSEGITVNRSIDDVYSFWRNFQNFPRFMRHIERIDVNGVRSHWRAIGPAGMRVEWEAELVEDVDGERISWRSVEKSDVDHHGSVRFARAPGARGTEVEVHLHYNPPAGQLGRGLAWLLGSDPERQIREDLRRFKQIMEVGEVVLSDGPALRRSAQPADEPARIKHLAGVQS